jgi:hypothetical protein
MPWSITDLEVDVHSYKEPRIAFSGKLTMKEDIRIDEYCRFVLCNT